MDPLTIGQLIMSLVQGIVTSAPSILEGVDKAKKALQALFGAGVIDKATQDAQMAYVDALGQLAQVGAIPAAWRVEPDPEP